MLKTVDFYYFSPTGGTKKAGEILANDIAECVNELCFEVLGDIGIEERDGKYVVIPEYEQEIRQWLNL